MKPCNILDQAATPDGGFLQLSERDGDFVISHDGHELMHSRAVASETLLGSIGMADLKPDGENRVLIGGLGLGFTLKSVLESAGTDSIVEVVELMPAVVEWNRQQLRALNGKLLENSRVTVRVQDVTRSIRMAKPRTYDSIMLDVDNGPIAMVADGNTSLYSDTGVEMIRRALKPGGRAFIWSASHDAQFESRLKKAHMEFETIAAKAHEQAGSAKYLIYVLKPS